MSVAAASRRLRQEDKDERQKRERLANLKATRAAQNKRLKRDLQARVAGSGGRLRRARRNQLIRDRGSVVGRLNRQIRQLEAELNAGQKR